MMHGSEAQYWTYMVLLLMLLVAVLVARRARPGLMLKHAGIWLAIFAGAALAIALAGRYLT